VNVAENTPARKEHPSPPQLGELWQLVKSESVFREPIGDDDGGAVFKIEAGEMVVVVCDTHYLRWNEVQVLTRNGVGWIAFDYLLKVA
jgi:hypothetical protein